MTMPRLLAVLILPLALTACGGEKKADPVATAAGGDVLEGSVSDAMVPLDTVRSQPPLAPRAADEGDSGDGGAAAKAKDKPVRKPASPADESQPEPAGQPAARPDAE